MLLAGLSAIGIYHNAQKDTSEITIVDKKQFPFELPPYQEYSTTTSTRRVVSEWLERQQKHQYTAAQHLPTVRSIQSSISQLRELVKWQSHARSTVISTDMATEQRHKETFPQGSEKVQSTIRSLPVPQQVVNTSQSRGYVLALDYWEQQTSGSRNLQNLQCWAAQYNLSVVEPAMVGSLLKTPLNNHPISKGFWFRDVFDLAMWNRLSSKSFHSELVAWDHFLSSAPRTVILVSFKHAFPDEIKQRLKKLAISKQSPTPLSERITKGCKTNWDSAKQFFNKNHFNVVREICFNFAYGDRLSNDQFKSYLYGHLSPASSTVVFRQWRGTGPPARVLIHDAKCGNTHIQEEVGPSQQLLLTAAKYQQLFLGGGPYIAVMARMEKVKSYLKKKKKHIPTLGQCFLKLLAAWRDIKHQRGLNDTLLAIDMGKYGSNSIHDVGRGSELSNGFEEFFRSLYGSELSLESWEESFESVAHTTDSGYVALLQKVLVVQAKCVVFIGGGSFQKHAQALYLQSHHTEPCIKIVHECTPAKNLYALT